MTTLAKLQSCLVCAALLALLTVPAGAPADTLEADPRPNIVILMTDDQTLESMRVMSQTRALIGRAGATFTNSFVNNPRCCPSRATFLTGQYSHNHGVLTNGPPAGGWPQLRGTTNWLPAWLEQSGYHTVHVGKFLNQYGLFDPTEVPPGWDEWYATVDPTTYRYYGYTLNENGTPRTYGVSGDPRWYATDFVAGRSAEIVRRLSRSPQPFFLSVAFLAPHSGGPREPGDPAGLGTPAVAPRHRGRLATAGLPLDASFNEADVSDKPPGVRRGRLGEWEIADVETAYRQRLESLLAVDEAVATIHDALQATGELDRTLILFTSDNGYLTGEHRLRHGKAQVYEPVIRVPLLMRGPGVPRGVRPTQLVTNADLAPTLLDAARAIPGRPQDGRSLLPLTTDPQLGRGRPLLVEIGKGAWITTWAIRTPRWLYAERAGGRRELYDLVADPDQLESLHASRRHVRVRAALARALRALRRCRGTTCRRARAVTRLRVAPPQRRAGRQKPRR